RYFISPSGTAAPDLSTLTLHDALPIWALICAEGSDRPRLGPNLDALGRHGGAEHLHRLGVETSTDRLGAKSAQHRGMLPRLGRVGGHLAQRLGRRPAECLALVAHDPSLGRVAQGHRTICWRKAGEE